jgi:hypothetical protein
MSNRTPVPFNAEAAFHAQAVRTAAFVVKQRARAYAKRPMGLETISPGLAAAAPETLAAMAKHLIEREKEAPRRWFGFGGEVPILNARAILLLARARRRAANARGRPMRAKPALPAPELHP